MKKIISLTFLFLSPFFLLAQKINYVKTFEEASSLSKNKNKSIFVFIESPSEQHARIKALEEPNVVNLINQNFIPLKLSFVDAQNNELIKKYAISRFPAFLFFTKEQELFYKQHGNYIDSKKYVDIIQLALAASKQKKLSDYEKDYAVNKDSTTLKSLLDYRYKQGLTSPELIESYIDFLKIGDFNNYKTVLYILEAGPYLDGNAYKLCFNNKKIYDSIYKYEPYQKRVVINNKIRSNTMQSAIKHKNINRAYVASSFARNVWGKNYLAGSKAEDYEMLYYYKSIKDTSRYLQRASSYYDNYYMKVSADSIKKMTSKRNELNLEQVKKKAGVASKAKLDSIVKSGGVIPSVLKDTFTVRTRMSTGNSYASALNNIAYDFYLTGTKNLTHLSKALIWSKRSIELDPKSEYYDTLAHIYYAMKIYNEANATQKTAVEIARTTKQPQKAEQYIQELKKMEAKQL